MTGQDRLQELLDHFDIRRLLCEYCHGCDRRDRRRMAGVYAEGSWEDHGANKCSGPDYTDYVMHGLSGATEMVSHQLGQSIIHVRGDEAGAETYFVATVRPASNERDLPILSQIGGRYVDRLVRVDHGWRIEHRICVRDWSIDHDARSDRQAMAPYVTGKMSAKDAAYSVLDWTHSGDPPA